MEHLLLFICIDIALICKRRHKASCSITASADKWSVLAAGIVARLCATFFSLAGDTALTHTCLVIYIFHRLAVNDAFELQTDQVEPIVVHQGANSQTKDKSKYEDFLVPGPVLGNHTEEPWKAIGAQNERLVNHASDEERKEDASRVDGVADSAVLLVSIEEPANANISRRQFNHEHHDTEDNCPVHEGQCAHEYRQ